MRLHQRKASLEQAKVSVHSLKCKPAYEAPASASSGSLQKARAYLLARSGSSPSCFRTLTIPGSQKRIAYKPVQLQPQQTCPSYLSLSLSHHSNTWQGHCLNWVGSTSDISASPQSEPAKEEQAISLARFVCFVCFAWFAWVSWFPCIS